MQTGNDNTAVEEVAGLGITTLSQQFAASVDYRFQFQKRSQLFIRTHNETLSVVATRVSNSDRLPVRIKS
jgi:hypothetical protein